MAATTGVRSTRARLVLVVALVLVWAGCSRTASLDLEAAEKSIAHRLAEGYGTDVERVQCPGEVSAKSGKTFSCQARLDVGTVTVEAEIKDSHGALTLTPDRARIEVAEVSKELSDRLAEQAGPVLVACEGAPVRLVPVGSTFPCRAGDGESNRTIEVTVRNWEGGLDFAVTST